MLRPRRGLGSGPLACRPLAAQRLLRSLQLRKLGHLLLCGPRLAASAIPGGTQDRTATQGAKAKRPFCRAHGGHDVQHTGSQPDGLSELVPAAPMVDATPGVLPDSGVVGVGGGVADVHHCAERDQGAVGAAKRLDVAREHHHQNDLSDVHDKRRLWPSAVQNIGVAEGPALVALALFPNDRPMLGGDSPCTCRVVGDLNPIVLHVLIGRLQIAPDVLASPRTLRLQELVKSFKALDLRAVAWLTSVRCHEQNVQKRHDRGPESKCASQRSTTERPEREHASLLHQKTRKECDPHNPRPRQPDQPSDKHIAAPRLLPRQADHRSRAPRTGRLG
mmetsp:Transcript_120687/g.341260  ORF Transcript_120687/g.341260 Transcript_120687/m.341260 type:complete len:333 (+) Transcript_120687:305-1303(+)